MRKLGLVLFAFGFLFANAYALDLNISGAGARAKGMGGAFIGVADDATAVSWNPAGLAQLDKPEASAVGLFNFTKVTDEWKYIDGTDPAWNFAGDEENTAKHLALNFFSLVLPMKMGERNLTFAVAYQRMVDFGEVTSDTGTSASGHWEQENKFTGGIDAITPAIALQIAPQLSVGLAANILVNGATLTQDRVYDNDAYFYNYEEEMDFSGFNMNAGALATLNKYLSIGAAFRFPFTMARTGKWSEEWSYISGSGTDGEKLLDPQREWTMPMMIGTGLALRPTENLTLAFDFEHRGYSGTEYTYYYEILGVEYDTTYNAGWMSTNQFRAGLEYLFIGQNAIFPVRLGFKTNPQLDPEVTWTQTATGWSADSAAVSGVTFTSGFGMKMGSLWFDLAYEMGKTTVTLEEHYLDGSLYTNEAKELSHNILASCIVHF